MDVFISWSGPKSHALAKALHDWLPSVVQAVKPWLSTDSLSSGTRWTPELTERLASTDFGILAITPSSVSEPWLVFEAGALSKVVEAKVVPVVLNVSKAISGPLGQFQARDVSNDDLLELCRDLNKACGDSQISETLLVRQFARCWGEMEQLLEEVAAVEEPAPAAPSPARRSEDDMVEEILLRVRDLQRDRRPNSARNPRLIVDLVSTVAAIDGGVFEIDYDESAGILIRYSPVYNDGEPSENVRRAFKSLEGLVHMRIRWMADDDVVPF